MDRQSFLWAFAFAYIAYAAIGDLPSLAANPIFSTTASAGLFVVLYLGHSYVYLGIKTATKFLLVSAVLGYLFEFLFISTGWLGTYVYTADLSPFIGPIPAFIPLLWASLTYFCMLSADSYLVSAFLVVLLDVAFDPKFSTTLWRWVPPGQYFGVPIANFAGWLVTSAAIYLAFYLVTRRRTRSTNRAIAFYYHIGIFVGVVPDLVPGLYGAGEISFVLFSIACLLIYLNSRRVAGRKGAEQRLAPSSGTPGGTGN